MFDREQLEHGVAFHQTLANQAKLGAYYTDSEHCRRIGQMIRWPEGQDVAILEPSIGDGNAIMQVIAGAERSKMHIYGVEMNVDTYVSTLSTGICESLLGEDFLHGIIVSQKAFNFCFVNPPYGKGEEDKRLEQLFVEKMFGYLKTDALLALVVPNYLLMETERFAKSFYARFKPLSVYRFDDKVYSQFKQVVIFARRKDRIEANKMEFEQWCRSVDAPEKLPYLPVQAPELKDRYKVSGTVSKDGWQGLADFKTKNFDPDRARADLLHSACFGKFGNQLGKEYHAIIAGEPPLPPTKENSHMIGVCGAGSGFAGNEDEGTLHLQRGVVENVTSVGFQTDDDGNNAKIVETSTSATSMHIIDANFNYIKLDGGSREAEEAEEAEE